MTEGSDLDTVEERMARHKVRSNGLEVIPGVISFRELLCLNSPKAGLSERTDYILRFLD
jgi:hypothetical protein